MITNYEEFALICKYQKYFHKEDIKNFSKRYKEYDSSRKMESLENESDNYIFPLNTDELITFMEKIKDII